MRRAGQFTTLVARAEQMIPQRRRHAEIGLGVVVMDMVTRCPAAQPRRSKAHGVDGEMTEAIADIAESDGAAKQARVTERYQQRECQGQANQDDRG